MRQFIRPLIISHNSPFFASFILDECTPRANVFFRFILAAFSRDRRRDIIRIDAREDRISAKRRFLYVTCKVYGYKSRKMVESMEKCFIVEI